MDCLSHFKPCGSTHPIFNNESRQYHIQSNHLVAMATASAGVTGAAWATAACASVASKVTTGRLGGSMAMAPSGRLNSGSGVSGRGGGDGEEGNAGPTPVTPTRAVPTDAVVIKVG